ncbi:hypothetical protein IGI37_001788 [Enterococcus sp. AZ194]|uniref:GNAT family N-acetyltransferase n=1 Tax=Enterococcus sp. AZ194 TaxID=2774629 RepID=UPI003F1EB76C
MEHLQIKRIDQFPEKLMEAAEWFHDKWGVPVEAYTESMEASLVQANVIPKWYIVLDESEQIIAGAGVIENDFHDRPDLTPNICAVYVSEENRGQRISQELLSFICTDMNENGVNTLYLITDHKGLYEKYGWSFLTMVHDEEGQTQMYTIDL